MCQITILSHGVIVGRWQSYEDGLDGLTLVAVDNELIDEIWTSDREPRPNEQLMIHSLGFAGD